MKPLWIATIVATMLIPASACAQNPAVKPSTSDNSLTPAIVAELAGTDMVAELSHSVSAKKAKPGDLVKAALTQDVLAHGRIVIRRGSKLMGHVTETQVRTKDNQESRLGMVFDKAVLKGGQEIDFRADIRALAAGVQMSSVDVPDQMSPPSTGNRGTPTANPQPMGAGSVRGATNGPGANTNTGGTAANAESQLALDRAATAASSSAPGSAYGVMGGGSRGVFGLPGLQLKAPTGPEHATIITSIRQNVKLETGTQLVIQVNNLIR
jgi:hypothetical protein